VGTWIAHVSRYAEAGQEGALIFRSLGEALHAWRGVPGEAVIRIMDSARHDIGTETLDTLMRICPADPDARRTLTLEAVDGEVPTLRGALALVDAGPGLDVTVRGLWIDGSVDVGPGVAARFEHCTIGRPGRPAGNNGRALRLSGSAAKPATATLGECLAGPCWVGADARLEAIDSIVDAGAGAAVAGEGGVSLLRTTILGWTDIAWFRATDSLVAGAVAAADGQASHCGFDPPAELPAMSACCTFNSSLVRRDLRRPRYARLPAGAGEEVRAGASDGSEMGAFNRELTLARERLLLSQIPEWVPAGTAWEVALR
jgi:hypothetical protein